MYLYCYIYVFLLYVYVFLLLFVCCILFHCVGLCLNMYIQLKPGLNSIALKNYIYIINFFHQGHDCPVRYELLSPLDWYLHGVWQIFADIIEKYATSFVGVLCCPGDDVSISFSWTSVHVSAALRCHISEQGNFQGHYRRNLSVYCREVGARNWIHSNVTMKSVVLVLISWGYYLFQISVY